MDYLGIPFKLLKFPCPVLLGYMFENDSRVVPEKFEGKSLLSR